jgi:hypothetical protein
MTDHQVRLCAERVEYASQFDRDITSTDDGNPLGLFLDIEKAVRVDTVRCAGDLVVRGNSGSTADSDDKLFRPDGVLGAVGPFNLDLVLVEE